MAKLFKRLLTAIIEKWLEGDKIMRKWLFTCNDEGVSNLDVITAAITIIAAFIIPVVFVKLFGVC